MSETLLDNPLVLYNWHPGLQLQGFLSSAIAVEAGDPGATDTIVAVGDSTTAGYGNIPAGFRNLQAYPNYLTATLSSDGIAAQDNDFLGDGAVAASDSRISVTASDWSTTVTDAGASVIETTAGDGGVTFTPSSGPTTFNQVSVDYVDLGTGTADVAVDGKQVGTITMTGTGDTETATFNLPEGQYSSISITAATSTPVYIEGISTYDTKHPAIQVYNAGWSGAAAVVLLQGSQGETATTGYGEAQGVEELGSNLALINLGINDFIYGVAVDTAAAAVENFALTLRSEGTDPIIIIPTPVDSPSWAPYITEFRSDIYSFSTLYDIPVIDLSATYDDNGAELYAQGLTPDGTHPSAALYAEIGNNIGTLLAQAILADTEPSGVESIIAALGPAATAIQPTSPAITVTGLPSTGGDTIVKQASGDIDIGLWTAASNAAGPATPVTISLGQTYYQVDVIDEAADGAYVDSFYDVSTISLSVSDPLVIQINPTTLTGYPDTTVTSAGSGFDMLTLEVAEDSYQTNAHFTVDVNGVQVGGVFTATAAHSQGAEQSFSIYGNFGPAAEVTVNLLDPSREVQDSTAQILTQKLLYIESDTYNGVTTSLDLALNWNPSSFVADPSAPQPATAVGEPSGVQSVISWLGPALATPTVTAPDITVTGLPSTGGDIIVEEASGDIDIGLWTAASSAAGPATPVTISLGQTYYQVDVIDAAAGGAYVDSFYDVSTISLSVTDPLVIQINPTTLTGYPDTTVTSAGSGFDMLTLEVAEDSYQTNAHFTVDVNGVQVGGVFTATAAHSQGAEQAFTLHGNFGTDAEVTINLLDPSREVQDQSGQIVVQKTLYVESATYDGAATPLSIDLTWNPSSFTVSAPSLPGGEPSAVASVITGLGPALATPTVTAPDITVTGLPSTGGDTIVEQASGDIDIGLWTAASNAAGPATPVTISLGQTYYQVDVIDAAAGGSVVDTYYDVSAISLSVTDPLVIQINPTTLSGYPDTTAKSGGSGANVLTLEVAEDSYQTNAHFTVDVNGVQVGGVFTATAAHSQGAEQTFTLYGNFGADAAVTVNLLDPSREVLDQTAQILAQKTLYIESATYNSITTPLNLDLTWNPSSFTLDTPASQPGTVVLGGSGPDTLALSLNENQTGGAQFTVSVDGTQVGGVQTTAASLAAGQTQQFDVLGTFSGQHSVTIDVLNTAVTSPGNPATAATLFLQSATIDGAAVPASTLTLSSSAPQSLSFTSDENAAVTPVTLNMSEDAYSGDAQFIYSIDGGALTSAQIVTASHAAGQTEAFALPQLTAGMHSLTLDFINAAAASPTLERNLYVDSIQVGGVVVANSSAALFSNGAVSFTFVVPPHS